MQDWYNRIFALLTPLEYGTLLAQPASPYYNWPSLISNFLYPSAIYNPQTLLWLQGVTYHQFKTEYQTYLVLGEPRYISNQDLYRSIIWPFNNTANGTTYLFVLFKATAPTITLAHIPALPLSVGSQILEFGTMATCLEQRREFRKAAIWWNKIFVQDSNSGISLWDQCKVEIDGLARADKNNVLEPYRWVFHGGAFTTATQITGETPSGATNGTNNIFTLANVPNPATSLVLTVNAVTQVLNVDYTLNGQTITFMVVPPNAATILASYQLQ